MALLLWVFASAGIPAALQGGEVIVLNDTRPRATGNPDPVTGFVEMVRAGDRLPVAGWSEWVRSPAGGAMRFVTVLTESGALAKFRHDEVAQIVHEVPHDELGVQPESGIPMGCSRMIVAVQDRHTRRNHFEFFDRKVVFVPVYGLRNEETEGVENVYSCRSAAVEQPDLDRASELVLSVEFAAGSGVSAATPFAVGTEDFTGDGEKELVIEAHATTITAGAAYANSSHETHVFTFAGGDPSPLVRLVNVTETVGHTIEYTHLVERNSNGTVKELRQYAVQRAAGGRHRVDKSVRRYRGGDFEWVLERNRMTRVIPNNRRAELRVEPHIESRVRDWLMRPEPVRPVDVRSDEEGTVWLKIDQPRGASGWIRDSHVRWRPHQP